MIERQRSGEFGEIVDFAVVTDRISAIGRRHRLPARIRKIEDTQPGVTKPHAIVCVFTLHVRSAVMQQLECQRMLPSDSSVSVTAPARRSGYSAHIATAKSGIVAGMVKMHVLLLTLWSRVSRISCLRFRVELEM